MLCGIDSKTDVNITLLVRAAFRVLATHQSVKNTHHFLQCTQVHTVVLRVPSD